MHLYSPLNNASPLQVNEKVIEIAQKIVDIERNINT